MKEFFKITRELSPGERVMFHSGGRYLPKGARRKGILRAEITTPSGKTWQAKCVGYSFHAAALFEIIE